MDKIDLIIWFESQILKRKRRKRKKKSWIKRLLR